MSEFNGMSIQERIRAMNKTIDKVGALPTGTATGSSVHEASTTRTRTSDPAGENDTNQDADTDVDVPMHVHQKPQGRASVVDMWRSREATSTAAPKAKQQQQQPQQQPSLRKKSVLEKWSSAQQKSVALEKVVIDMADADNEEKKDYDDSSPTSPPKLSVAEMIAQKSVAMSMPKTAKQASTMPHKPAVAKPSPQQLTPKMSVADLIAQRASTLGTATSPASVQTAPKISVAADKISQRAAMLATTNATKSMATHDGAVAGNNESAASSSSATAKTMAATSTSDSLQRNEMHSSSETAVPPLKRPSVSDFWKKRAAPVDSEQPSSSTTPMVVGKERSTGDLAMGSTTLSVPEEENSSGSNPIGSSKPSWARRSAPTVSTKLSSPSPIKNAPDMDAKPAWATTVLKRREPNAVPSSPSTSSADETKLADSKPTWARKSLQSTPPVQKAAPAPAADFKPEWARKSLNSAVLTSPTLPPVSASKPVNTKPSWAQTSVIPIETSSVNEERPRESTPAGVEHERASGTVLPKKAQVPVGTFSAPFLNVEKPGESASGPVWAKKSLQPNLPAFSSPPSKDHRSTSSSEPSWKRTSMEAIASSKSPAPVPASVTKKPSWTAASYRKTDNNSVKDDTNVDYAPNETLSLAQSSSYGLKLKPAGVDATSSKDRVTTLESSTDASQGPNSIDVEVTTVGSVDSVIDGVQESAEPTNESPKTLPAVSQVMATPTGSTDNLTDDQPVTKVASPLARHPFVAVAEQGSKRISAVDWPTSDEAEQQHARPQLSIVGPQSPPRPLGVRSPSATDFWNRIEKEPASSEPNSSTTGVDTTSRTATPLMELAMRYKFSPARAGAATTTRSTQPVPKPSGPQRQGETVKAKGDVGGSRDLASPTPPRFARRRNRVAQKHLSSKSIATSASSDLESVDVQATMSKTAIPTRSLTGNDQRATKADASDQPCRIVITRSHASPTRISISNHGDAMSPKSSRLSRPEEKKEIQKRRNRMKGRDDEPSVASGDSQCAISQGSSLGGREDELDTLQKDRARSRVNIEVQTSAAGLTPERVNARPTQTATFRQSNKTEPKSVNQASGDVAHASGRHLKSSTFGSAISRMAMAKLANESDNESPMSEFSKEKGSGGAFSPYVVAVKSSTSDGPRYIPDVLSPRKLNPNSPGRFQMKKEDDAKKSRTVSRSEVGLSDVWSMLTGDVSGSSDSRSVVSSASGASALAERATKVLQRRRGAKASPSPKKPPEATLATPAFPFPASGNLVSRQQKEGAPFDEDCLPASRHDVAGESWTGPVSATPQHGKSNKKSKRSAIDRSGFVNRYKSSERFIDSSGADLAIGPTPRLVHDEPQPNFSYGSEISTTSSVAAASSDDGSEPYINERTASMKSDSTAGPMGIDENFQLESSTNMNAMKDAYESVTAADLASDLKEELTGTLTGSLEAMKNLASEFGKLAVGQKASCESIQFRKAYVRPSQQLNSVASDEEEVAIEVEYIGDDDESSIDEGEDLCEKIPLTASDNGAPAGQSSAEVYV
jgi:hypothetical protein